MARAAHTPHLWSRSEYERMAEAGIFEPGVRMELIDGEILETAPQGTRHFTAIRLIEDVLRAIFGDGWDIRTQGPLAIDDRSEPEPDVALARLRLFDSGFCHFRAILAPSGAVSA